MVWTTKRRVLNKQKPISEKELNFTKKSIKL